MIAFKTFHDCLESQIPSGVPLDWPWQEMVCTEAQSEELQSVGYTVISEEAYASYKSAHQAEYNAWLQSNTLAATRAFIDSKILSYQLLAPKLLRELYVDNTLAGISTAQSDQLFDDYQDIIFRISQGAFPTALRRLLLKRPNGFVTQQLLDNWVAKINSYL